MKLIYASLFVVSVIGTAGQILLKLAANGKAWLDILRDWRLWVGGMCYATGFIVWVNALSKLDVRAVYPFTAFIFVLVCLASHFVLGEIYSDMEIVGALVITAGFLLMFKGGLA